MQGKGGPFVPVLASRAGSCAMPARLAGGSPSPRRRKDVGAPCSGGDARTRSAPDSCRDAEELRAVIPRIVEYCLGKQLRSLDEK